MLFDEFGRLMRDVEVDAIYSALFHFEIDRSGHDIPWCEFRALIMGRHEACAVRQFEDAAFTPYRFRNQKRFGMCMIEAGRMKLDEFHISHPATGAPAHGNTIAGGGVRISGVEVNLAGATGCHDDMACRNGHDLTAQGIEYVGTEASILRFTKFCGRYQINRIVVF